jgi:glycosyltransferase involved in cell wall biosynthesis
LADRSVDEAKRAKISVYSQPKRKAQGLNNNSILPACRPGKLMLLTNKLHASPRGGRELLCKLNHDALKEIYGNRLVLLELPVSRLNGMKSVVGAFRGYIDGLNNDVIRKALQTIQTENIGKIFVDGSNLGAFVKIVKRELPNVEISTFFHNVEARFFLGALRQTTALRAALRALGILIVNYLAERKAVRYSDKVICLGERDSRLLQKLFGRAATHVSPMALHDTLPKKPEFSASETGEKPHEKFALFVGGVFYANRAGITWFIDHVVPRIDIRIFIVGRGFDDFRPQLERRGKVVVVGAVDNLSEWYLNAQFVIAPIFDGSGMKTKIAEALMYGKKIVGTPEAFSGYEEIADRAGWVCESADDFVDAIRRATDSVIEPFAPDLRTLYEERHSYPAARFRLAKILSADAC